MKTAREAFEETLAKEERRARRLQLPAPNREDAEALYREALLPSTAGCASLLYMLQKRIGPRRVSSNKLAVGVALFATEQAQKGVRTVGVPLSCLGKAINWTVFREVL
jgi:hypothetical protein